MRLLDSPRRRRRLTWAAAALGAAALVVVLTVVIGDRSPGNPAPTRNEGPAQLASTVRYRLSAADRRKISALFAVWMPAAVGREDARVAWRYAGPELRAAAPYPEWVKGTMPVPTYPIAATGLDGWRALDVERDAVVFNVLAHARPGAHVSDWVFAGRVVRRGAGWAVNEIYTIALMNPVRHTTHEVGPADFQAPPTSSGRAEPAGPSFLGHGWLLAGIAVPALVLLGLLAAGLVALLRSRRWKRSVRAAGRNELPPLPASYRRS